MHPMYLTLWQYNFTLIGCLLGSVSILWFMINASGHSSVTPEMDKIKIFWELITIQMAVRGQEVFYELSVPSFQV